MIKALPTIWLDQSSENFGLYIKFLTFSKEITGNFVSAMFGDDDQFVGRKLDRSNRPGISSVTSYKFKLIPAAMHEYHAQPIKTDSW